MKKYICEKCNNKIILGDKFEILKDIPIANEQNIDTDLGYVGKFNGYKIKFNNGLNDYDNIEVCCNKCNNEMQKF